MCILFLTTAIHTYGKSGSSNYLFYPLDQYFITTLDDDTLELKITNSNSSNLEILGCPADITLNTGIGQATVKITYVPPTTNIGGNYVMERISGMSSGSAFPVGVTIITYIERDRTTVLPDGKTCEFRVTVIDSEPPVFERCGYNTVIKNGSNICYATGVTIQKPKAIDNATESSNITLIGTRDDGLDLNDAYPVGITTITWRAKDGSGNISTPCTNTVTVNDYYISKNIEAGKCTANITWPEPAASPGFSLVRITNLASGSDFPVGATTITYQERVIGTTTPTGRSCSFIVTVIDEKIPNITSFPADKIIDARANDCYATALEAGITVPTATDNCSNASNITIVGTRDDGKDLYTEYFGKTIITWIAYDVTGNMSAPYEQTITVLPRNTVTPTAAPIPDATVTCRNDIPKANVNLIKKIVTNCDIVRKGVEKEEYDNFTHTFIRTYFFEDGVGNKGLVKQKYFIQDTFKPTASCKDVTLFLDANGKAKLHPYQLDNGSSDNCNDGVSFSLANINWRDNIALGKKATQSTTAYGGVASIAVDGNNDGTKVTHTQHFDVSNGWWEVDLGASYPIQEIVIWNRTNLYAERLNDFTITLFDANDRVVAFQDFKTQPDPHLVISSLKGNANRIRVTTNKSEPLSIAEFQVFSTPHATREFDCTNLGENQVTFHVKDSSGNLSSCTATVTVIDTQVDIEVSEDQFCSGGTLTFTANSTNAKLSPRYQWYIDNTAQGVPTTNPIFIPATILDGAEVYVELITQSTFCGLKNIKSNTITMKVYPELLGVSAGVNIENQDCLSTAVNLLATPAKGSWSVVSGQTTGYYFNDVEASDAVFIGQSGEKYTLQWKAHNPLSPCEAVDTLTIVFGKCENVEFNGSYSYISLGNHYNLDNSSFTIESWINGKTFSGNSGAQTIFSKRDASNPTTGYDLSIVNSKLQFSWGNTTLQADNDMMTDKWYHVAMIFDKESAKYTMVIDGLYTKTKTGGMSPLVNSKSTLIGAGNIGAFAPGNYFKGGVDEVRIWNTALNLNQIREMMNQEIKAVGTDVSGVTIDRIISDNLKWSNLVGYYQMKDGNQASVIDGKIEDISLSQVQGTLNKMMVSQNENAPIPYKTKANGNWDHPNTWQSGIKQYPNSSLNSIVEGQVQTWNIVMTDHNVYTPQRSLALQGLFVNSNTLSVVDEQPIYIKDLKINGILKLIGESQLLPFDEDSKVDYTGTGVLERDQKGTGSKYKYNYWGSPVQSRNTGGNQTFALGTVLSGNNLPVNWISGNDSDTRPNSHVILSNRWLQLYNGRTDQDWQRINELYNISVGLGYTMKGSGIVSDEQNYTFKGQPNNGEIRVPTLRNNVVLIGNPYPSAIDANQFIDNNKNILLYGALRFWVHAPGANTHVLAPYQGRYSYYTKAGSLPAAEVPGSAIKDDAKKSPRRYIPVGQGFLVDSNAEGGTINFNNSQRIFKKEAEGESEFSKSSDNFSQVILNKTSDTNDDKIQRIRLSFKTPEGAKRHLMLGFTPDNLATDGIDYGFDALNSDNFPSDLSFAIAGKKFVIQGVGAFEINKEYPLDMILGIPGNVEIALTELENFDTPIDIVIYDKLLGTYTKINYANFQLPLVAGRYTDRFYIVFQGDETMSVIDQDFKEINVKYLQRTNEIYVKIPSNIEVKQVYLVTLAGQKVNSWNLFNLHFSTEFKIPVNNIAQGTYILKVETSTNTYSKKVIIK